MLDKNQINQTSFRHFYISKIKELFCISNASFVKSIFTFSLSLHADLQTNLLKTNNIINIERH